MDFNENELWRVEGGASELKMARAKVLLKLEFNTEDQVLFFI